MIIKPTGMEQEDILQGEERAKFIGNAQLRLTRADQIPISMTEHVQLTLNLHKNGETLLGSYCV